MKRYLTLLLVILLTAAFCSAAFANAPAQSAQNAPSTQTAQDFSSKIAGMNKISNIRIGHTGDNIRIVVDGSQKIAYRSFSLSNPDRFAVDIQNAWLAQSAPRQIPIQGSKFVQQVRISQFDAKTVRIVVDATVFSDQVNIFALPDPHRLVMDFGNVNKPPANIQKELERVQQTIEAEKKSAEQAKKEPAKQSSNPFEIDFEIIDDLPHGTIIYPPDTKEKDKPKKHAKPGLRGKTIVVDAGHGGSDCGAVGQNGLLEKDVTLKVALRLENI